MKIDTDPLIFALVYSDFPYVNVRLLFTLSLKNTILSLLFLHMKRGCHPISLLYICYTTMQELQKWKGMLAGKRQNTAETVLRNPIESRRIFTSSGAFRGRAADNNQYWIKPLNNLQSERLPATEQIVSRVAKLISAPVCDVATIMIPKSLCEPAYEYCAGRFLEPGIAHASLQMRPPVQFTDDLAWRDKDDNTSRHAYLFALYDWCWGEDEQWLISTTDDFAYFSHDHGDYLPLGPNWSIDSLKDNVDASRELHRNTTGISRIAVKGVIAKLRSVTRDQIRDILIQIPTSWPVTDEELEVVGCFLERRIPSVVDRLKRRFAP